MICQEDIRGYELKLISWMEQFDTISEISDDELDKAMKADILKMSQKQMQKFKIEFKKAKNQKKGISKDKMLRMLLDYLKPNSEYDILLLIKRLKIFLHIEIKSFSTSVNVPFEETQRYVILFLRREVI